MPQSSLTELTAVVTAGAEAVGAPAPADAAALCCQMAYLHVHASFACHTSHLRPASLK